MMKLKSKTTNHYTWSIIAIIILLSSLLPSTLFIITDAFHSPSSLSHPYASYRLHVKSNTWCYHDRHHIPFLHHHEKAFAYYFKRRFYFHLSSSSKSNNYSNGKDDDDENDKNFLNKKTSSNANEKYKHTRKKAPKPFTGLPKMNEKNYKLNADRNTSDSPSRNKQSILPPPPSSSAGYRDKKWKKGSRITMRRPGYQKRMELYTRNGNGNETKMSKNDSAYGNKGKNKIDSDKQSRGSTGKPRISSPTTTIHEYRKQSRVGGRPSRTLIRGMQNSARNRKKITKGNKTAVSILPPPTYSDQLNTDKFPGNATNPSTLWNAFLSSNKNETTSKKGKKTDNVNKSMKRKQKSWLPKDVDKKYKTTRQYDHDIDIQSRRIEDLPPPSYLFGDNDKIDTSKSSLMKKINDTNDTTDNQSSSPKSSSTSLPSLDGVLPVSELFYRSTQSISAEEEHDDEYGSTKDRGNNNDQDEGDIRERIMKGQYLPHSSEGDDEELPFSAEQSDRIHTTNNKICIRRNNAMKLDQDDEEQNDNDTDGAKYKTDLAKLRASSSSKTTSLNQIFPQSKPSNKTRRNRKRGNSVRNNRNKNRKTSPGRKMVRRGMEMLVGGEPINADPPLRFMELHYDFEAANTLSTLGNDIGIATNYLSSLQQSIDLSITNTADLESDWAGIITTNSRDFGPLLHKSSVGKVTNISRQLYCEHFVNASMKWKVCPTDIKGLAKSFQLNQSSNKDNLPKTVQDYDQLLQHMTDSISTTENQAATSNDVTKSDQIGDNNKDNEITTKTSFRGFGKSNQKKKIEKYTSNRVDFVSKTSFKASVEKSESNNRASRRSKMKETFSLGGELKFTLGLTRAELESGHDGGSHGHILRRVLGNGIAAAIRADSLGFNVVIAKLILNEVDGGATEFNVEFNMLPREKMPYEKVEHVAKTINAELAHAMDYGDMALAMGAAAKSEMAWPAKVRKRIVEEFLFDNDDDDEPVTETGNDSIDDENDFEFRREELGFQNPLEEEQNDEDTFDGPFGMPGDTIYAKDDIFLGGGNGGVFMDYSENSINSSPWQGNLGPLLVDAVVQRVIQRQPRVIAIGDVHGCLDELQALLRRCDYRPGDLIVFLGDLVSKGPDSLSVVQMARELGAIGVRGNHDFEVIRWHQAIKSGADPPIVGSEHYTIASNLEKADLKWMYSLPWYLASKELSALFVHAGFVSGIRLGKQNPRLMMNMRSILPDGTVTSKFFNNWPWARLWDGPQTVLFGHDADRGLQQYEHAIGLDTGCVYGGRLTACILPEKKLVSVNAKRAYFQYRRKHFD